MHILHNFFIVVEQKSSFSELALSASNKAVAGVVAHIKTRVEAAPQCYHSLVAPALHNSDSPGRYYGFTASNEMLFTPNFLLALRALSEMNW